MSETSEPPAPRVAVLMPVHNDRAGLFRSLESLRDEPAPFDVVVVDDGSTPPLSVPPELPFRVELVRLAPNRGIVGALNAGLAHITRSGGYTYVARLDAGDVCRPGRLAAQAAFLEDHPDHAVVGSAVTFVDLSGAPLFVFRPPCGDRELRRFQRYRIGFVHPAMMLRLAALEALGAYDERFRGAEDYELVLRLARGWKLANLGDIYLDYEVNPNALSARRFRQGLTRLRVQLHHFAPGDPHAWLGLARNLLLLLVTRNFVLGLKRVRHRWLSKDFSPSN